MSNQDEDEDGEDEDETEDATDLSTTQYAHYMDMYANIVRKCPSIEQFGVQNRVWQVQRVYKPIGDGMWHEEISLGPREEPDVAEAFLVVRI